jgi:hypothetical protein
VLIEAVAPVRVVAPEPLGFVPRLRADEDDVETMGEKRRKRYPEIMASHRIRRPTVRQLCASETRNVRTPADSGGLGRQRPVPRILLNHAGLWLRSGAGVGTYPVWGCHASPVLKLRPVRSISVRKRGFRPASVRSRALRWAETGTNSGIKSSTGEGSGEVSDGKPVLQGAFILSSIYRPTVNDRKESSWSRRAMI